MSVDPDGLILPVSSLHTALFGEAEFQSTVRSGEVQLLAEREDW